MENRINWIEYLDPLMKLYGTRKHPLEYKNRYQLVVMVVLSAQDSDRHINELADGFFELYPSIKNLAGAAPADLKKSINSVRNFENKTKWLLAMAKSVGDDEKIPTTLSELVKLPGIGRKSANVIIRESGGTAEGIIVDLHVVRVAPRIGIATGDKPEKIEKQLMEVVPKERWNEIGMAMSFLGREICRPTNPKCDICVMNIVCKYYNGSLKKKK